MSIMRNTSFTFLYNEYSFRISIHNVKNLIKYKNSYSLEIIISFHESILCTKQVLKLKSLFSGLSSLSLSILYSFGSASLKVSHSHCILASNI